MKIIHPELSSEIFFSEETVNELVIENSDFLFRTVNDFYNQINKCSGEYVLSHKNEPLDFSASVELITQFVPFEVNKKSLLNKLYNRLKKTALSPDLYVNTAEMSENVFKYVNNIISEIDTSLDYDIDFDVSYIFKAINLRFCEDYDTLSEKLIDYMLNVREYDGDKIFILVNYRSYVSSTEAESFIKTAVNHKLKILLIEGSERELLLCEKRTIIDKDLCEIY